MFLHRARLRWYQGRKQELLASPNPLAAVVLAHLKVLETRRDPDERFRWKVRLVQGLYDRGLSREEVGWPGGFSGGARGHGHLGPRRGRFRSKTLSANDLRREFSRY